MRIGRLLPVMAIAALLFVSPAAAQDNAFKIFLALDWISPLGEEDVTFGSVEDSLEAASDLGWEAGFEWRLNKVVGLEGSYMVAEQDIDFGNDPAASVKSGWINAALNFHIIPAEHFDLWVAPVASWVNWDDIEFDPALGQPTAEAESDVAFGAALGFDIGIGDVFAITAGLKWLSLDLQTNGNNIPVDPLIARAGVAFRFGKR